MAVLRLITSSYLVGPPPPSPTGPAMRPGQSPMHRHSRTFGDPVATNGLNGAFGQLPDPPSLFEGPTGKTPLPRGFVFLACHQDCRPMHG